jgi:hypothetical protein
MTIVLENVEVKLTPQQVISIIKQLPAEEQAEVRKALFEQVEDKEDWKSSLEKLILTLKERERSGYNAESLPELTDDDIVAEVKAVRRERYEREQRKRLEGGL